MQHSCIKCPQSLEVKTLSQMYTTVAINELLCMKNVGAQIAMDFSLNEGLAPIAIEKIKILGTILELPAKQHCQSSPFTSKLGQIGQIGSAV